MLRSALLFTALALPGLAQTADSKPSPCAAPAEDGRLGLQFFACLNNKREQSENILQEVYSDCGPASPRYKSIFFAYMKLKASSNAVLNTLVQDLRNGTSKDKIDEALYVSLLKDLRDKSEAFDTLAKTKVNCADQPDTTRALPLVVLALGVLKDALLTNLRHRADAWLAGDEAKRTARAKELEGQRWRDPKDFQMPLPAAPR